MASWQLERNNNVCHEPKTMIRTTNLTRRTQTNTTTETTMREINKLTNIRNLFRADAEIGLHIEMSIIKLQPSSLLRRIEKRWTQKPNRGKTKPACGNRHW
jgi:hypothetical protein